MGDSETTPTTEPRELPLHVLRSDLIEPGDVILTRGSGRGSQQVAAITGGSFSHAALIINQAMLFESDGGIVGHKAIIWLGWGMVEGELTRLARLGSEPSHMAVYRHPGLRVFPAGAFDAALQEELEQSYGKDYSELHRLVPLTNLPDKLKPLVTAAFKLYERRTGKTKIPGPFCSELVSRVYQKMGLALFDDGRAPDQMSPNSLANSHLRLMGDLVISSANVSNFEAVDQSYNVTEKLFPPTGDHIAKYRRDQRGVQQEFSALEEVLGQAKAESVQQLMTIRTQFYEQLQSTFDLFQRADASSEYLIAMWALRLCEDSLEFSSELAILTTQDVDPKRMRDGMLKFGEIGTSFFRCKTIYASRSLKHEASEERGAIRRYRIRRARGEILREARAFLISKREMQSFTNKLWARMEKPQPTS